MASQPEHVPETEDLVISPAAHSHLQARLAHIDAELKRVFQEREALIKERRETVLLDAKTRCRNFATEFTSCLPREIRDMVYAEVWLEPFNRDQPRLPLSFDEFDRRKEKWEKMFTRSSFCDSPWLYPCNEKPCRCYLLSDLPVWVSPQFMGDQVATEAAESYYRVKHMAVAADGLPDLEAFLANDHLHMGIKPSNFIRQLSLHIEATEENELGYMDIEDFAKMKMYLKPLLDLRLKQGFHLDLLIVGEGDRPIDVLTALRFVVVPFKTAGSIVKVKLNTSQGFDDEISDFYDIPINEWITKREAIRIERHGAYGDSSETESESSEDTSDSDDPETVEEEEVSEVDETISFDGSEGAAPDRSGHFDHATIPTPAPYHVIYRLAERGQTDPELLRLTKIVAAGEASTEELVAFDECLDAIREQDDS